MPKYLFSYDLKHNCFLERYRVVSADEDTAYLRAAEDLTGTVVDSEAIAFLEEMMARCQADESIAIEFVDAPSWRFVASRFDPAKAEAAERRPGTP